MDVSKAIAPRSDQLNAQDFAHTGPQTFTITGARDGSAERDLDVTLAETERVFRPSKSMARVIVSLYGKESDAWAGKRIRLYCDPEVKYGGKKVGGIKISHASDIAKPIEVILTETRGKNTLHTVQPLPATPSQPAPDPVDWFASKGVTLAALEAHVALPRAEWTAETVATLRNDAQALIAANTPDGAA